MLLNIDFKIRNVSFAHAFNIKIYVNIQKCKTCIYLAFSTIKNSTVSAQYFAIDLPEK